MNRSLTGEEQVAILIGCALGIIVMIMRFHYGNFSDVFDLIGKIMGCLIVGFLLTVIFCVYGKTFSRTIEGFTYLEDMDNKFKQVSKDLDDLGSTIYRHSERVKEQSEKIKELTEVIKKDSKTLMQKDVDQALEQTVTGLSLEELIDEEPK
jgi:predicted PurR-regulated permease PerM